MQLKKAAPAFSAERLLAAALALPAVLPVAVTPARAQVAPPEHGTLSIKYLDYLDSQPGNERVRIKAPVVGVVAPFRALGGPWSFAGSLIHDDISGASPAYHTRSLRRLEDKRDALELGLTRHFTRTSLTAGASYSTEADYIGRALSLTLARASEDNNTTWSAGLAVGRDSINPVTRAVVNEHKRRTDLVAGVTQVLTPTDIVQVNLGTTRNRGYLSDPYKVNDHRPRARSQHTVALRWNHHLEGLGATLRSQYRWYHDSFGIRSHTLATEWVQPLPGGFTLTPALRLYTQTAARFYVDAEPAASPFPPNPPEGAEFFSEDQRLSGFGGRTWGLKLARAFGDDVSVDVKFERYVQRGGWQWRGAGSPHLAEFRARSITLGLAWKF